MDENNNYEQTNSMEEQSPPAAEMTDDALKEVIKTQLEKVRMAALPSRWRSFRRASARARSGGWRSGSDPVPAPGLSSLPIALC